MSDDTQRCELCGRFVPRSLITKHHLTPKEKGGTHGDKSPLCKPCHKMVHATWGNADLAKKFAGIEQLRLAEELQPFLQCGSANSGRTVTLRWRCRTTTRDPSGSGRKADDGRGDSRPRRG